MNRALCFLAIAALAFSAPLHALVYYGSLDNFDAVNDTGVECHGFEIEVSDVHSTDISYTYDWNHYGVPKITEDNSDPLHPRVFVRYESPRNPDGSWAAYTAVPSGPIAPTDGHMFTDPSVNFGGEHFGVGFLAPVTTVTYGWLVDNGAGGLVKSGSVNIATPTFTYVPPAPAVPAQVQAAIVPPPPAAPPVLEFGEASWVKEIRTQTHNANKVELRDLVTDDPNDPNDRNWTNGEPDEVEVEWQMLQTEFANPNNPNGELVGAPEDLNNGDEVITRRYEFFKYVGPLDAETGEAMADQVAPDGIHGVGTKIINGVEVDLSQVVVVGDYIGAQMAGYDSQGQIGLIDHLQDGEIDVPYVARTLVIGGTPPIVTSTSGALPAGMDFDTATGVLTGTPTEVGHFAFGVHSTDAASGDVTKQYELVIVSAGVEPPAQAHITTSAAPAQGGVTGGDGSYDAGTDVTVTASANPGFQFVNWTDGGTVVSTTNSFQFAASVNRALVANFVQTFAVTTSASPLAGGTTSGDGTYIAGDPVTVNATANAGYQFVNWTDGGTVVSTAASYQFAAAADAALVANFVQTFTVTTSAAPSAGGSTGGDGTYSSGDSVTVSATPTPGYVFVNWTEGGAAVSSLASYTFSIGANRTLIANFAPAPSARTIKKLTIDGRVRGGSPVTGFITLSGAAEPGGVLVFLSSSNPGVVSVPASVYIAGGQKTASFAGTTSTVAQNTVVSVTASLGSSVKTASVKVLK